MINAICFRGVRPGDVVCQVEGQEDEISVVRHVAGTVYLRIKDSGGVDIEGKPDQIIGLLHRPWQEGSAAPFLMQEALIDAMRDFLHASSETREEKLRAVREVLDTYELGKPLESTPPTAVRKDRGHHIDSYEDGFAG